MPVIGSMVPSGRVNGSLTAKTVSVPPLGHGEGLPWLNWVTRPPAGGGGENDFTFCSGEEEAEESMKLYGWTHFSAHKKDQGPKVGAVESLYHKLKDSL